MIPDLAHIKLVQQYRSNVREGYDVMVGDRAVGEIYCYLSDKRAWRAKLKRATGQELAVRPRPVCVNMCGDFRSLSTAARAVDKLVGKPAAMEAYAAALAHATVIETMTLMRVSLSNARTWSRVYASDLDPVANAEIVAIVADIDALEDRVAAALAARNGADVAPADLAPALGVPCATLAS